MNSVAHDSHKDIEKSLDEKVDQALAESGHLESVNHQMQNLSTFLILRLGELIIAAFFVTKLPLWMPATWLALLWLGAGIETLVFFYKKKRAITWSTEKKMWTERAAFWLTSAFFGSAAYFLYVNGDLTMITLLCIGLVATAIVSVMQFTGDHICGSVAAVLVTLPVAVRLFFGDGWLYIALGIGGIVLLIALIVLNYNQYVTFLEQTKLRKQAEIARDTVAQTSINMMRFFASVSHDLRQPVHAIGLHLAPLTASPLNAAQNQAVAGISDSWKALDGLLSQVLDIARLDAGTLQAHMNIVDIKPLLRSLIAQYAVRAEDKYIRLVILCHSNCAVHADYLMLTRVLANLLDNAIKFSPEGGRIVLAVRKRGNNWRIQVRDGGIGIPEALQKEVFKEFAQAGNPERNRSQGVGLGLAIARRFVELMNGTLHVRSKPQIGTTFSVDLLAASHSFQAEKSGPYRAIGPERAKSNAAELLALKLPAIRNKEKVKIVLLEDDELVAQGIKNIFVSFGLQLQVVSDGRSAIDLINQCNYLISDYRIPGDLDGLDVAQRFSHKGIPSVLITAETTPEVRQRASALGIPLLVKPVHPQKLIDHVAQAIDAKS